MITINLHLNTAVKPEIVETQYGNWGTVRMLFGRNDVSIFVADLGQLRRLSDLLKEIAGQAQAQPANDLNFPPIEPGVTRAEVEAIQIPPDEDLPF